MDFLTTFFISNLHYYSQYNCFIYLHFVEGVLIYD